MKRFTVGFFLIVSMLFIGFIAGGTIAKYFFVSPGDGLAAAGTAAMLGFLGAGVGLILSIILLRKLEEKAKTILAVVLVVVSVILFGVFHHQYKQRQLERERENAELFGDRKPSTAVASTALAEEVPEASAELRLADGTEMGIGIVSISPEVGKTLRFYSKPEQYELPENLQPLDSLTFKDARHFVDIATAPPWFVPQYMKLDYGILQLVAVTVQKNWIEVIVNKTNGQTHWVYKPDVGYANWSDFLLNVQSVELLNPSHFPPRIKPIDHASPVENVDGNGIFHPISVKDDWLQVHPDKEVKHDIWVRWKRNGILLVKYSMLS